MRSRPAPTDGHASSACSCEPTSVTATPIGGLEMLAGLAFGEPRAIVLGLASVAYAGWLLHLTQRPETLGHETTVTRLASVTLGLIAVAAVIEPAGQPPPVVR